VDDLKDDYMIVCFNFDRIGKMFI